MISLPVKLNQICIIISDVKTKKNPFFPGSIVIIFPLVNLNYTIIIKGGIVYKIHIYLLYIQDRKEY